MLNTINSLDQTMSSFEIAQITGKQHKNVMRDIRELNKSYEKLYGLKIEQKLKISDLGFGRQRKDPYFELTKIQTWDLLTGYNAELRIKVNRRWAELEAQEQYHFPTPKIFNEVRCVHYMSWLLRNGYSLMSGQVRARIKKYPEQFRKTDKGWYMSEAIADYFLNFKNPQQRISELPSVNPKWVPMFSKEELLEMMRK